MRLNAINRTRKLKILHQVLTGESALLRQLKGFPPRKSIFTQEEIEAMSDEQLEALIRLRPGKSCSNFEAMTDEELEAIIKQGGRES
ncbi:hypothetical protein GCM10028807_34440 [Spirosoma daeguense]